MDREATLPASITHVTLRCVTEERNQAKSSEIKQYLAKSSEIKQQITKKRSKSIGLGLHFTVGCPSCHKTSESYLNFTIDTLQNLA